MSVIFKISNTIKVGYFGKLVFWGNQAAFAEVFGYNTTILAHPVTSQDTTTTASIFINLVKNSIWMCLCICAGGNISYTIQ